MKGYFAVIILIMSISVGYSQEPTSQATNISFTNISPTSATISWTNGNGTGGRIVVMTAVEFFSLTPPTDGVAYTPNANFGTGPTTATGSFVVHDVNNFGPSSFTVTGLTAGILYQVEVFEYNGTGTGRDYLQRADGVIDNPRLLRAAPNKPLTASSNVTVGGIDTDRGTIQWTPGSGGGRLIVARENSAVNQVPTDNVTYNARPDFGTGASVGPFSQGNFAVFDRQDVAGIPAPTLETITNLSAATTYHFQIFDYNTNGASGITNMSYMATGPTISFTTLAFEPGVQAKDVSTGSSTTSSITLSWTASPSFTTGNLVVAKQGTTVDKEPQDAQSYTASATFGSGQHLGNGNYVVYNGTGNSATITNLQPNTKYTFKVFAYNGNGVTLNYNVNAASSNPAILNTSTEPATQASALTALNIGTTQLDLNWTSGNGERRIVIGKLGTSVDGVPADGTSYTASATFGSGTNVGGTSSFVVYDGTGTSVTVTGLTSATAYTFKVFEYNSSISVDYNFSVSTNNPRTISTVVAEPANQPTADVLTTKGANSLSYSFTGSAGGAAGYLVVRNSGSAVTSTPSDGTTYSNGSLLMGSDKVVYSGATPSFTDNSIASGTRHYYKVFAFNGSGSNVNYNVTAPLTFDGMTFYFEPSDQASNFSVTNLSEASMTINYSTSGVTADGFLVLRRSSAAPTGSPADGTVYTVGTTISDGEVVYVGAGSSLNQSSLAANNQYFYKIFSYNGTDTEINYNPTNPLQGDQTTLPLEPTQPSSLSTNGITGSGLTLMFNASAGGADGYLILRKAGSAPIAAVPSDATVYSTNSTLGDATVIYDGSATSVNDASLNAGTLYQYVIYAFNANAGGRNYNVSKNGNAISALTLPPIVNANAASGITQTSFTANWTAVASAMGYLLDVSRDNFSTFLTGYSAKPISGTSELIGSLEPGITYSYRVRAVNESGNGPLSNTISQITIPPAPTLHGATNVSEKSFTLSWDATTGATGYQLDVSTDGFATRVQGYDNVSVTSTSVTVNVESATLYQYRVRAINGAGASPSSAPGTQTTLCKAPVALDAINLGALSFTAKWNESAGATSYNLEISQNNSFTSLLPGFAPKNVTSTNEIVVGLSASTSYWYRVSAVNAGGESAYSQVIPVRTLEGAGGSQPLLIIISSLTESITLQTSVELAATVTGGKAPFSVKLFYKALTESAMHEKPATLSQNQTYACTLDASAFDGVGITYYFQVTDNANEVRETEKKEVYLLPTPSVVNVGELPLSDNLGSGGKLQDYRIFSIPYQLKQPGIQSVFRELGDYDKRKWRLIHYQNGKNVDYTEGIVDIEQGKSYWFNSATPLTKIYLGEAELPDYDDNTAFQLVLDPGWNQIGNPFPFDLNWPAVLKANNNPSTLNGSLKIYNSDDVKFDDSQTLSAWSGGFVKVNGSQTITINLPASLKGKTGGRLSNKTENRDIDTDEWSLPIRVSQGIVKNVIGEIGMHPRASAGVDAFDDEAPPPFMRYLELTSYINPDSKARFSTDIVRTIDRHAWQLFLQSNDDNSDIIMDWDAVALEKANATLVLHDVDNNILIDMKKTNAYSLAASRKTNIKIYFSRDGVLDFHLNTIGSAFPNPVSKSTTIPVLVSDDLRGISISIFNNQGIKIRTINEYFERGGFHEVVWDCTTDGGTRVAAGTYYYRSANTAGATVKRLLVY